MLCNWQISFFFSLSVKYAERVVGTSREVVSTRVYVIANRSTLHRDSVRPRASICRRRRAAGRATRLSLPRARRRSQTVGGRCVRRAMAADAGRSVDTLAPRLTASKHTGHDHRRSYVEARGGNCLVAI